MGVVNVTPDSFFDGGRYFDHAAAIRHGEELLADGADLLDVGGESTRPGADPVGEAEELRRILPVVRALAPMGRVSIDTTKPAVARAAIEAGATLINDVGGELAPLAAASGAGLVVMHHRGTPKDMVRYAHYDDVVAEVTAALLDAAGRARALGVAELYLDPGIGFAKTAAHNLALLDALPALVGHGDVLVGTSRKSFLGELAAGGAGHRPLPPERRLPGSVATAVFAMLAGARIVRVHDVRVTVQARTLLGPRAGALSGAVAVAAGP